MRMGVHGLALIPALALWLLVAGSAHPAPEHCAAPAREAGWQAPDAGPGEALDALVERATAARVIVVGELHDRFDHHLYQLELLCRLARGERPVALGLEAFQWPAQPVLDRYVAGTLDLDALVRESGWFDRWGFDFRLYAPLLELARAEGIALVALNAPSDLTRAVGRAGLAALAPGDRARLPADIPTPDDAYRARLREVYEHHPAGMRGDFEHFVQVQTVWDESMAATASDYLGHHPGTVLMVVAGNGHVAHASTIPARVAKRRAGPVPAIALDAGEGADLDGLVRLASTPIELPAKGRIGVALADGETGVRIEQVVEDSAAAAAGLEPGDEIVALAGHPIRRVSDLLALLWRAQPGDRHELTVRRAGGVEETSTVTLR